MDIAVIGSNMVDLITYTNQMPKEGETLEAPAFKIGAVVKARIRRWPPLK
jgi:ribokinase